MYNKLCNKQDDFFSNRLYLHKGQRSLIQFNKQTCHFILLSYASSMATSSSSIFFYNVNNKSKGDFHKLQGYFIFT
jgi:hypothetical protein